MPLKGRVLCILNSIEKGLKNLFLISIAYNPMFLPTMITTNSGIPEGLTSVTAVTLQNRAGGKQSAQKVVLAQGVGRLSRQKFRGAASFFMRFMAD